MTTNSLLYKTIFISLMIHTMVICSSYWMKMPELRRARDKRVEITYRPPSPKNLDIRQHAIKPAQKLDLQNLLLSASNNTIGVKLTKDDALKGMTMYERKPTQIKSMQVNYITVTPITSENINSPIYTSYNDRVRQSIQERAIANYSRLDDGKVYLTFIISSDGSLKDYQIIDGKTNASQNLRYISIKSLEEAHFPPFLKGMTLPEYTFNIEIDYQVSDR